MRLKRRSARPDDKYQLLHNYMNNIDPSKIEFSITMWSLESVLGYDFPLSSRKYREWWANHIGNKQAQAWMKAGWKVDSVNLNAETVAFIRTRNFPK